jgi:hypothetical protein
VETYEPQHENGYYHCGAFCPFTDPTNKAPKKALPDPEFRASKRLQKRKERTRKKKQQETMQAHAERHGAAAEADPQGAATEADPQGSAAEQPDA